MRHSRSLGLMLLITLTLAPAGCRRKPQPSSPGAAALSGQPALPRVAAALPALQAPALSALPADQAVAQLMRAHYDPSTMGLSELRFDVDLSLPQLKTRALASATWRKDQIVAVKIGSVERKGRTETAPADPGVGQQIWTALQYQTQHLLEGVGAGFLSERLHQWQKLKGESKLDGGKLVLTFHDKTGETVVTVRPGWIVEKVENHSPRKIDRWMEYQHRLEQGRNLVTLARMHVAIAEGASLPPGEVSLLRSQEGLTFRIDYKDIGGYLLPVQLRKSSSRGDETLLKMVYTEVK